MEIFDENRLEWVIIFWVISAFAGNDNEINFEPHFKLILASSLEQEIDLAFILFDIDFQALRYSFQHDKVSRTTGFESEKYSPAKILFGQLKLHIESIWKQQHNSSIGEFEVSVPDRMLIVNRDGRLWQFFPFEVLQCEKLSYYESIVLYKRVLQTCDSSIFHEDWKLINDSLNSKLGTIK